MDGDRGLSCPVCSSTEIEFLWVKPEPPKKPYQRWWCVCGAKGIVQGSCQKARKNTNAD